MDQIEVNHTLIPGHEGREWGVGCSARCTGSNDTAYVANTERDVPQRVIRGEHLKTSEESSVEQREDAEKRIRVRG